MIKLQNSTQSRTLEEQDHRRPPENYHRLILGHKYSLHLILIASTLSVQHTKHRSKTLLRDKHITTEVLSHTPCELGQLSIGTPLWKYTQQHTHPVN